MTKVKRNTAVVSLSLKQSSLKKLDSISREKGLSRSSVVEQLVNQQLSDATWKEIYRKGQETARRYKITSEDDIDKILHEA